MASSILAAPLLLAASLVALRLLSGEFIAYQIALFLIYGIATQAVALCWGRLGFLPLGHALFFGLGAYLTGAALKAAQTNGLWVLALPLALIVPALLAYVIAQLVFARSPRSGPYFSLITLAMTMLGFLAALQWNSLTGGFNGLRDIPEIPGLDRYGTFYWLVATCAVTSTALLGLLLRRPIGVVWSAVAQNEDRMQLFGYATDRIKAVGFALSALLAAAAGGLFAIHQGIVTPLAMGFVLSTEFVIWAAVGGKASPLGALLGAVLVGYASAELRDHFASWEVFVGILFILVVRFLPAGIAGLAERYFGSALVKTERADSSAPGTQVAGAELFTTAPKIHRPQAALALEIQSVETSAGSVKILDSLSLKLEGNGIRSLIGPNGAGKTSTFNALTGRLPVHKGQIRLDGENVTGLNAWRIARRGVGRKLQIPSVMPALTVRQNLSVALWVGRVRGKQWVDTAPSHWRSELQALMLRRFPELLDQLDRPAGSLSQGHRQALEFVMTVSPEPRLLLLDEPCAGLSPAETQRMIDVIQEAVRSLNAAALLIEHDMSAVRAIGGVVFVMHQGKLLAQGSLSEIQSDPVVRAVYAGGHK